ncbi:MAG: SRPBCC family protein [Anaerolineales bacterium]|jgi:carbon monoxide dehydrogenase subunit G
MIRFENRIHIDRPREEVFDFVSDFENVPKWNYFVESVRKVDQIPIGMGAQFHQIRKTDQQHFEIIEFERPSKVTVKTLEGSLPKFTMDFEFETKGDATILTDTWQLETGHNPFLELIGKSKIKSAVADNLSKLKQLMETHKARLQDGKIVTI